MINTNMNFRIRKNVLKKYTGNESKVIVPEGVEEIGEEAFANLDNIISIVLPDSLKVIGTVAFSGCKSLKNINIPNNVVEIHAFAFSGCESLENINISNNVTLIGWGAFSNCVSIKHIVLPDSLKFIGASVFEGCKALDNFTIPKGINEISSFFFHDCKSLSGISITDNITKIGMRAFEGCEKLTEITIPGSVVSIEERAFEGCSNLEKIIMLEGVTRIEKGAFNGLNNLKKVIMPESVTYIGKKAFYGCRNLEMNIPKEIKYLGEDCLYGCDNVERKMTYDIENGVLINCCGKCDEAIVPETVNTIKKGAFISCMTRRLVLPKTVQTIDAGAFSDNNESINMVTLPLSLEKKVMDLFDNNDNLQELKIDENSEKMKCVDGVLYSKDMKTLIFYPRGKKNKEFTVPDTVQRIEHGAFKGAHFLEKLNLPDNLISIGAEAFKGIMVEYIVIPKSVNKMAEKAIKVMYRDGPDYYHHSGEAEWYTPRVILYRKELIRSLSGSINIAYAGNINDVSYDRRRQVLEGYIFVINNNVKGCDKFREYYIEFIIENIHDWVKGFSENIEKWKTLRDENMRLMMRDRMISKGDANNIIDSINNTDEECQRELFYIKSELMEYCNTFESGNNDEFELTEIEFN